MNWRSIIIVILSTLLLASCSVKLNSKYAKFNAKPNHTFRVASYNVNFGGGSWKRNNIQSTINAIKFIKADILVIQESTTKWETLFKKQFSKRYPYQTYLHFQSNNGGGLGVLSRYPITNKKIIASIVHRYPALLVDVKSPIGRLQILNVHLTPTMTPHRLAGLKPYSIFASGGVRKKEIQHFYQSLQLKYPTIIAGDMNQNTPEGAINFLRKRGFVDAHLLNPKARPTWHWPLVLNVLSGRFDYIFFTPQKLHAVQAQVLHEGGSDHFPVVVDFRR